MNNRHTSINKTGVNRRFKSPSGWLYFRSMNTLLHVQHVLFPLAVSISELQPKDKKHKDEKTRLLCQTTLDLLPYVMGTAPSSSVSATPTSCAASPMPTGSTTCELVMHPCVNLEGNAYLLGVISEDKKVKYLLFTKINRQINYRTVITNSTHV